jgi:hypothetical protein
LTSGKPQKIYIDAKVRNSALNELRNAGFFV